LKAQDQECPRQREGESVREPDETEGGGETGGAREGGREGKKEAKTKTAASRVARPHVLSVSLCKRAMCQRDMWDAGMHRDELEDQPSLQKYVI
jgi:hypothetical protein